MDSFKWVSHVYPSFLLFSHPQTWKLARIINAKSANLYVPFFRAWQLFNLSTNCIGNEPLSPHLQSNLWGECRLPYSWCFAKMWRVVWMVVGGQRHFIHRTPILLTSQIVTSSWKQNKTYRKPNWQKNGRSIQWKGKMGYRLKMLFKLCTVMKRMY